MGFGTNPPVTGTSSNVQVQFDNGVYSIQLTITDRNGCRDTKLATNYITVTGPIADFAAIDPGGCKNSNIRFSDLSSTTGPITQWKWDFGDGQSQTFTAPPFVHKYVDTGHYRVKLSAPITGVVRIQLVSLTSCGSLHLRLIFMQPAPCFVRVGSFNSKILPQVTSPITTGVLEMEVLQLWKIPFMFMLAQILYTALS